jgi:hypothetical protein
MLSEPLIFINKPQIKSSLNLVKNVHPHTQMILVVNISAILRNGVAFYINKKSNLLVCLTELVQDLKMYV